MSLVLSGGGGGEVSVLPKRLFVRIQDRIVFVANYKNRNLFATNSNHDYKPCNQYGLRRIAQEPAECMIVEIAEQALQSGVIPKLYFLSSDPDAVERDLLSTAFSLCIVSCAVHKLLSCSTMYFLSRRLLDVVQELLSLELLSLAIFKNFNKNRKN